MRPTRIESGRTSIQGSCSLGSGAENSSRGTNTVTSPPCRPSRPTTSSFVTLITLMSAVTPSTSKAAGPPASSTISLPCASLLRTEPASAYTRASACCSSLGYCAPRPKSSPGSPSPVAPTEGSGIPALALASSSSSSVDIAVLAASAYMRRARSPPGILLRIQTSPGYGIFEVVEALVDCDNSAIDAPPALPVTLTNYNDTSACAC